MASQPDRNPHTQYQGKRQPEVQTKYAPEVLALQSPPPGEDSARCAGQTHGRGGQKIPARRLAKAGVMALQGDVSCSSPRFI